MRLEDRSNDVVLVRRFSVYPDPYNSRLILAHTQHRRTKTRRSTCSLTCMCKISIGSNGWVLYRQRSCTAKRKAFKPSHHIRPSSTFVSSLIPGQWSSRACLISSVISICAQNSLLQLSFAAVALAQHHAPFPPVPASLSHTPDPQPPTFALGLVPLLIRSV